MVKTSQKKTKPKKRSAPAKPVSTKITKPALLRILRRAEVKRLKKECFTILRNDIGTFLDELIRTIVVFTVAGTRKTVTIHDLEAALESKKLYLGVGINENSKSSTLKSCNAKGLSGPKPRTTDGTTAPHRHVPGSMAKKQIRFQKKHSDCLAIPKANFDRLVKEKSRKIMPTIRFSSEVLDLIQLATEVVFLKVCVKARTIAEYTGRQTLAPEDFQVLTVLIG